MRALTLVLVAACSSPMDAAVRSVNAAHSIGEEAAEVLHEECTSQYGKADTHGKIDELDSKCIPFRNAYRSFRRAHLAARLAVEAGGQEGPAAAMKAIEAGMELKKAIEAFK